MMDSRIHDEGCSWFLNRSMVTLLWGLAGLRTTGWFFCEIFRTPDDLSGVIARPSSEPSLKSYCGIVSSLMERGDSWSPLAISSEALEPHLRSWRLSLLTTIVCCGNDTRSFLMEEPSPRLFCVPYTDGWTMSLSSV